MTKTLAATTDLEMDIGSDDSIALQAELVAQGVRLIAQVGSCPSDPPKTIRAATVLDRHGRPDSIPFVVDTGLGWSSIGYASHQWALDLYEWVMTSRNVPEPIVHSILGLLHGYGPDQIRSFHERKTGRRTSSLLKYVSGACLRRTSDRLPPR